MLENTNREQHGGPCPFSEVSERAAMFHSCQPLSDSWVGREIREKKHSIWRMWRRNTSGWCVPFILVALWYPLSLLTWDVCTFFEKIRMVPAIFLKSVVRGCPFFTATVAVRKEVLQVGVAWPAQHSYLYSNITHLTSIWILHSAHTFTIVINSTIIKFQLCARYYYMQ